jgi:hypothetical protein
MQRAFGHHRGALHRMLGVPHSERIPRALLVEAAEHPERFYDRPESISLLRKRAQLALTAASIRRRRKRR